MPGCLLCHHQSPNYGGLHKHLHLHKLTAFHYYSRFPQALQERLDITTTKVIVVASLGECWEWTGLRDRKGYARMRVAGVDTDAGHRIALLINGTFPTKEDLVLHRCDNPPCVNPAHLSAGTSLANVHDRMEKGRSCRGDAHHKTKLGDVGAGLVRAAAVAGIPLAQIARDFSMSESAIGHVVARRSYAHVPEPDPDFIPW